MSVGQGQIEGVSRQRGRLRLRVLNTRPTARFMSLEQRNACDTCTCMCADVCLRNLSITQSYLWYMDTFGTL